MLVRNFLESKIINKEFENKYIKYGGKFIRANMADVEHALKGIDFPKSKN